MAVLRLNYIPVLLFLKEGNTSKIVFIGHGCSFKTKTLEDSESFLPL